MSDASKTSDDRDTGCLQFTQLDDWKELVSNRLEPSLFADKISDLSHVGCLVSGPMLTAFLGGGSSSHEADRTGHLVYHRVNHEDCDNHKLPHAFIPYEDYKLMSLEYRTDLATARDPDRRHTYITNAPLDILMSDDPDVKKSLPHDYEFITAQEAFRLSHPKHTDDTDCAKCLQVEEFLAEHPQSSSICDLSSRYSTESSGDA